MLKEVYHKLKMEIKPPAWVKHPVNLQIDTTGKCNLKCVYCNPQKCGWTPKKDIKFDICAELLDYYRNSGLWCVAPFMNGEPLLYGELNRFFDYAEKRGLKSVIDTNGTANNKRFNLIHKNLKLVRFTISAATAETYNIVHGKPKLLDALATFSHFNLFRLPNQKVWLHYIENIYNKHETEEWLIKFLNYGRSVLRIHTGKEYQPQSQKVDSGGTKTFYKPGSMKPNNYIETFVPCQCWYGQHISHDGLFIQCPDFPSDVNYGKVGDVDPLEAWRLKNRNAMQNKYCQNCNLKLPWADKLFKKFF